FLKDGLLVVDLCRLRRRYLLSRSFWWHVASVAPTQLLHCSPLARANRCLRAPRLLEAFQLLETRAGHPESFRVAKLMLCVFLAIHGHACLYFALSEHLGLGSDPWVCPNSSRPLRLYLHSFYISTLVLASVGDTPEPRRVPEFLFLTFGFLLAVLGFASVTGSVASVVSDMARATAALCPAPGPVLRLLRGAGLRGRVAAWHRHLREQRKPLAEAQVLRLLPRALRAQLQAELQLPALRRVPLFRGCQEQLLRQLVPRLRPQVLGPGELVCRRGDVGREMYFIREGRLAVMAEDGRTRLAVLGQGLYFGEISLINIRGNTSGNRRTADIVSIGYSDLFCLAKRDLVEVLAEFPSARAMLEARGRQLLLAMGKLDLQAEAKAVAEEEEAERQLQELEVALEQLQRQAARLLAQLEASTCKLASRVQRLEGWHQGQQPVGGQGQGRA
ncbi:CNGA4 protein, partial [Bucco capensis]|nr:CNGA4 protein [Bucco capensis]